MTHFDTEATICAIATGYENGCRGAVRLSGWSVLSILEKAQKIPDSLRTARSPTRSAVEWDLNAPFGLLPVDIWYWPTVRSYTGTPAIELHTLGHQLLLQRILDQLCEAGARLAMPGEFTLRAFLAGQMDLTQCEAVLGVIDAQSQDALEISLRQLAGGLSGPLASLRQSLIELLADLEAGLDFVEEDIQFISREQTLDRIAKARGMVEFLSQQLDQRHSGKQSPAVVLLGLPNAGKSSLANALAKANAAIVSDLAGTTRDFVRVPCQLQHGTVDVIDTAGIQATGVEPALLPEVDWLAQLHSQQQRDDADLILYCIDSRLEKSAKLHQLKLAFAIQDRQNAVNAPTANASMKSSSKVWIVWTKDDLNDPEDNHASMASTLGSLPSYVTSSFDQELLDCLRNGLDAWLLGRNDELTSVAPMTATRCRASLRTAVESLQAAFESADSRLGDEIVASELRLALEHLAEVAGEVYTDDVLDSLFSRFCIGK